jgi:hypothetical protein
LTEKKAKVGQIAQSKKKVGRYPKEKAEARILDEEKFN